MRFRFGLSLIFIDEGLYSAPFHSVFH